MLPLKREQVELPASSKLTFMNKKVSFAERADLMKAAAADLRSILDIIEAEAKALAEAQERFTAKGRLIIRPRSRTACGTAAPTPAGPPR
jgi:hypothetical protein